MPLPLLADPPLAYLAYAVTLDRRLYSARVEEGKVMVKEFKEAVYYARPAVALVRAVLEDCQEANGRGLV